MTIRNLCSGDWLELVRHHAEREEWTEDLIVKYQTFDLTDAWYNFIFRLSCEQGRPHKKSLEHKRKRTEKFASHELLIKLSFRHSESIFHSQSIQVCSEQTAPPPFNSPPPPTCNKYDDVYHVAALYIFGIFRFSRSFCPVLNIPVSLAEMQGWEQRKMY